ncbi:hypothetical protein [Roseibium aestuarii]|uniref:Flagellar protein FlaG n=1 Tax=Roseibium aestuarii TaxID=2600299 RepID=A0ABW4K0W8_9HYPH|nr:hypothetical protein [Roseibium aestuarii]
MDTALIRPQLPSYTAITPDTRAPERTEPAAATDLPVENTVSPSNDSGAGRRASDNPRNREPFSPTLNIERQNFIDPESETLIYQAKNRDTGEVVQQIPSETLRRLRAYNKTLSDQTTNGFTPRSATTA